MRNSAWPAFTSLPSLNRRCCRMPAARARTCATREASSRPGNSVCKPTSPGATVTTPTSGAGMPPPGGAAAGASALPQAISSTATEITDRRRAHDADRPGVASEGLNKSEGWGLWAGMGILEGMKSGEPPERAAGMAVAGIPNEGEGLKYTYILECMYSQTDTSPHLHVGTFDRRHDMVRRTKADAEATRHSLLDAADLFNAMMERVTLPLEETLAGIGKKASALDNPLQPLRDAIAHALHKAATDEQTRRVFEIATLQVEYNDEMHAVRARHLQGRNECVQQTAKVLRSAADHQGMTLAVPVQCAALGLHVMIDGLIQNWLLDTQAFDLRRCGRQVVDTYLNGLGFSQPGARAPRRPAGARDGSF